MLDMRKVIVECTLRVEVERPGGDEVNDEFVIEENACPGTGVVGRAIMQAIADGVRNNECWACKLGGVNKIVEVKS